MAYLPSPARHGVRTHPPRPAPCHPPSGGAFCRPFRRSFVRLRSRTTPDTRVGGWGGGDVCPCAASGGGGLLAFSSYYSRRAINAGEGSVPLDQSGEGRSSKGSVGGQFWPRGSNFPNNTHTTPKQNTKHMLVDCEYTMNHGGAGVPRPP
jgi:hypothetical protein